MKSNNSDNINILSSTPYDDVFRTILVDCKELIYPLLNEVFGENYDKSNIIDFHQNEHFMEQQNGVESKVITDESFDVLTSMMKFIKTYHLECQTNPDGTMCLRFFEYDSQIAIENAEINGDTLEINFPDSAVIYLRSYETTSDHLYIKVNMAHDSAMQEIKVLKIKNYTIDELFEKKLYILLPFSMFLFEDELPECETDKEKRKCLESKFSDIVNRLKTLSEKGEISYIQQISIIEMIKKTNYNLTIKMPEVQKGVERIMGGKVLDYPAKETYNEGRNVGINEGKKEGLDEASFVFGQLMNDGRLDDLQRAINDRNYLDGLVQEYCKKPTA